MLCNCIYYFTANDIKNNDPVFFEEDLELHNYTGLNNWSDNHAKLYGDNLCMIALYFYLWLNPLNCL